MAEVIEETPTIRALAVKAVEAVAVIAAHRFEATIKLAVNSALEEAAERILRSMPADRRPGPGRLNREHEKASRGALQSAASIVRDGIVR